MSSQSSQDKDDLLFGKIALNKRYITRELLDRALQYQRQHVPHVRLGELLLQKGVLTQPQVEDILDTQKKIKLKMTRPEGFAADPSSSGSRPNLGSPYPPPGGMAPAYNTPPGAYPTTPAPAYPQPPPTGTGSNAGHQPWLDATQAEAGEGPDPLIGLQIAGCVITQKLGAGGMGAVYLARKELLKKDFVVKILPPESAANPRTVERFKREAQAAARLEHPNIVQVHDVGETETGLHYIIMQYVDGKNLEDVIRARGKHSIPEATRMILDCARGLELAHKSGIIHRDIKADNILVTSQGIVKLADFGLAKDLNSDLKLTADGAMIGTPHYIAPEIGRVKEIDGRVDIYSLGITYYYLLTGEQPLRPFQAVEILSARAHEKIRPPEQLVPDLPLPVRNVLGKMLEKDREKRYPDVTALIRELECLERGQPVTAGQPGLWPAPGEAPAPSASGSKKSTRRGALTAPPAAAGDGSILGIPPVLFILLMVVGILVVGLLITLAWVLLK